MQTAPRGGRSGTSKVCSELQEGRSSGGPCRPGSPIPKKLFFSFVFFAHSVKITYANKNKKPLVFLSSSRLENAGSAGNQLHPFVFGRGGNAWGSKLSVVGRGRGRTIRS